MCAGQICGVSLNTFVITKWKWNVVIRKNNDKNTVTSSLYYGQY